MAAAVYLLSILFLAPLIMAAISLEQYNIELNSITTSGISSGAVMATQFHVIHSDDVHGVGLFAGVPYGCALGLIAEATNCMLFPGLINVLALYERAQSFSLLGYIDSTSNLRDDSIYIFHGTEDTVVRPASGDNVQRFYEHYTSNVQVVNLAAEHCMPTDNFGGPCANLNTENYINNCNYKATYHMMTHFYGSGIIQPTGDEGILSNLFEFDQSEYFYVSPPSLSSMDDIGYVYIPTACQDHVTPCKLHIAFHGCLQGRVEVGNVYVVHGGYLQVAELNNIIVLFPQAIKEVLINPNGCWDWWGYTNDLYDTRSGNQILAVKRMMDRLVSGNRL